MEGILRRLIGEDIALVAVLAGDLGKVKADPGQIEQVIMNLAVNDSTRCPRHRRRHDRGNGQPDLRPFFTTKGVGKGTGLGPSTALGIVEQSGGTLTVESKLYVGTAFRVYLPVTNEQPSTEKGNGMANFQGLGSRDDPPGGGRTPLRKLISQVLKSAGHTVLGAANGDEAAASNARHAGPIDLLLTDVIMPGMSGPELVGKLRSRRLQMTIVFMSGYDNELIDKNSLEMIASFAETFQSTALLNRISMRCRGTAAPGTVRSAERVESLLRASCASPKRRSNNSVTFFSKSSW
jgi:two-component system, cell cycle sensor histidine kinase and response regulator CckA